DGPVSLQVDRAVPTTGFRPALDFLREVRLDLDPVVEAPTKLGPLIDPEYHSCGTVPPHGANLLAHPEKDFYIAGMKSYGRAPTFLMFTGYEQVRSIVAALAGDRLPPTGSNSSSPKPGSARPISEPRATRAPILPRTTRAAVALLSPCISESLLVWPTGALQLTRQNDDHTPCPVRLREEWRQVPDGRRTHVRYRRRDD